MLQRLARKPLSSPEKTPHSHPYFTSLESVSQNRLTQIDKMETKQHTAKASDLNHL